MGKRKNGGHDRGEKGEAEERVGVTVRAGGVARARGPSNSTA